MWFYNIIVYNNEIISHILQIYTINPGYVLITTKLVTLKRENHDIILTVKRTEWRKFVDYFDLSIEADPSRVVKKNVYFVRIGYITSYSSVNIHISRYHM